MAGRSPVPTALKILRGNPGKRPLNKNEPQGQAEVPNHPPKWMSSVEKACWRRIKTIAPAGVITGSDMPAVEALACLMAELQESPRDFPNARWPQYRALLGQFGMVPGERSRLSVPAQEDTDDPWSNL